MNNKQKVFLWCGVLVGLVLMVVGLSSLDSNIGYQGVETSPSSAVHAEDSASTAGDSGVLSMGQRQDTPVAGTGADGDYQPLKSDNVGAIWVRELYSPDAFDNTNDVIASVNKPLAVSTYTPSLFSNLGANATLNVKGTAGNVYAVKVHNLNGAARYIQLHNTATTPAGAAVPLFTALVPANTELVLGREFFGDSGIHFSTGIAFAFSTTEATYTAGTSTDQMTFVIYK